jgi:hypothetical protein
MSASETPINWRKSSFSQNGDCVEESYAGDHVYVRDSKDPSGAMLKLTCDEWRSFLSSICSSQSRVGET